MVAKAARERRGAVSIAGAAQIIGVSAHTLRFYEKIGLIGPVERNAGRQRRYRHEELEWVEFLIRLREAGMGLSEVRTLAKLTLAGPATIPDRLALLDAEQDRVALMRTLLREQKRRVAVLHEQLRDAAFESSGTVE